MDIEITFNNVENILRDYCQDFERLIKGKLAQDGRNASGKLSNSIRTEIRVGDDSYDVILHSEDYIKWVEDGRKAASNYPPRDAIEKWVHDKGIVPEERNGRLPTEKQLVFLLSRAIANNGTIKDKNYQGGKYIKGTVEELNDRYIRRLQEALERDWNDVQFRIFEGINKMIRI